jgi:hypothetical protein
MLILFNNNNNNNNNIQHVHSACTSGVYREGSGLQPPPKCFKKLKNYFKRMLYFNDALCLIRICVQRQIVLGHSVNEI